MTGRDETIPQISLFGSESRVGTGLSQCCPQLSLKIRGTRENVRELSRRISWTFLIFLYCDAGLKWSQQHTSLAVEAFKAEHDCITRKLIRRWVASKNCIRWHLLSVKWVAIRTSNWQKHFSSLYSLSRDLFPSVSLRTSKQLFGFLVSTQNRTHVRRCGRAAFIRITSVTRWRQHCPDRGLVTITDSCCYYGKQLLTLPLRADLVTKDRGGIREDWWGN
jgi:hypothetical protein